MKSYPFVTRLRLLQDSSRYPTPLAYKKRAFTRQENECFLKLAPGRKTSELENLFEVKQRVVQSRLIWSGHRQVEGLWTFTGIRPQGGRPRLAGGGR